MLTSFLVWSAVAFPMPIVKPRPVDWVGWSTARAVRFWLPTGALPACGRPRFAWGQVPGAEARADRDACVVTFSTVRWPEWTSRPAALCVLVLHEIGHLYGHGHGEGGAMDPGPGKFFAPHAFWPCAPVPV